MIRNTLIIDDDKLSIYLTKTTLERTTNCKLFESVNNSNEAIEYLKYCLEKNKDSFPDLILLDLNMPDGNGWQFIEAYKLLMPKIKKQVNIFMLSCSFDKGNIIKAKNSPIINDFISKPIVKEDVDFIKQSIENKNKIEVYL